MSGSHSSSDESSDSRKRPPDRLLLPEPNPKRPNCDDAVHLKVLIPSIAAGAVIGKRGEAIAKIQNETNTKVKISKQDDYYPGTSERVCQVIGTVDGVKQVHNYIMDRVLEKPDPNPHATGEGRLNVERHKQVKILVPNSTAGMVIGRNGMHIQEIKDKTGAYVQVSQKSKEYNLLERCIIIAGDLEQTRAAVSEVVDVIASDPQSASCPNLSYQDVRGPVASAYPTGSPYALPMAGQDTSSTAAATSGWPLAPGQALDPVMALMAPFLSASQASISPRSPPPPGQLCFLPPSGATDSLYPTRLLRPLSSDPQLQHQTTTSLLVTSPSDQPPSRSLFEALHQHPVQAPVSFLAAAAGADRRQKAGGGEAEQSRSCTYPSFATSPVDRSDAMLLPQLPPQARSYLQPGIPPILTSSSIHSLPGALTAAVSMSAANPLLDVLTLSPYNTAGSSCTSGTPGFLTAPQHQHQQQSGIDQLTDQLSGVPQALAAMAASILYPSRPTELPAAAAAGLDRQQMSGGSQVMGLYSLSGVGAPAGGMSVPAVVSTAPSPEVYKQMILVPESVIGVIFGPQGRSLVELQARTGTTIQVSQKGIYMPGTQSRLVCISGPQAHVQAVASYLQQFATSEHLRRESLAAAATASSEHELVAAAAGLPQPSAPSGQPLAQPGGPVQPSLANGGCGGSDAGARAGGVATAPGTDACAGEPSQ